jgi:uroporphyrinogen-III synthase
VRPLLILRPEPGASATAARARALGFNVRLHPLFAPKPVPWTLPAGSFGALLITSANAVRLGGALPDLPVHAVGETSAAIAADAGLSIATVGTGGVEALLDTLAAGIRLLHPAGEERILPLSARQHITSVTVYRMVPLPLPAAAAFEGAVVLIHSPAAGRRLAEAALARERVRVAAISQAALVACGPGWERCEAADEPSDRALLGLAAKLCKEQGQ